LAKPTAKALTTRRNTKEQQKAKQNTRTNRNFNFISGLRKVKVAGGMDPSREKSWAKRNMRSNGKKRFGGKGAHAGRDPVPDQRGKRGVQGLQGVY
jgi:predicted transcriptional regulator